MNGLGLPVCWFQAGVLAFHPTFKRSTLWRILQWVVVANGMDTLPGASVTSTATYFPYI